METKRRKISISKTTTSVNGKSNDPSGILLTDSNRRGSSNLLASTNSRPSISYRLVPLANSVPNAPNISTSSTSGQQVLVMMPNREVLNSNVFVKRSSEDSFSKTVTEQKRRVMHKEIERRRRDKINDWILVLSKEVPGCASDRTKQGQSKGGILAKTAKYIEDLRTENDKLADVIKEKEELGKELERIRQQCMNTEAENQRLRALLQENNIPIH